MLNMRDQHSGRSAINENLVFRCLGNGNHHVRVQNRSQYLSGAHSTDVVLCSLSRPRRWFDAGVGIGMLRVNPLLSAN